MEEYLERPPLNVTLYDDVAPVCYDAMWTLALALNNTITGYCWREGEERGGGRGVREERGEGSEREERGERSEREERGEGSDGEKREKDGGAW